MSLSNKIDFAIIISVNNANPNGDPLNGNRPRTNYDGYGEMSDVCIKRKLRNRLLDSGEKILVQSNDYRIDEYESIQGRYSSVISQKQQKMNSTDQVKIACSTWFDVRAFGQVLAFKKAEKETKKESESITESESETKKESEKGLSISIRGPVSIQSAFSVETVDISTLQITKSLNNMIKDNGTRAKDTMGEKHRVDRGVYVTYGSINRQLAEKTGFNDNDAKILKTAMRKLFDNDESSARPAGSMEVLKVIWWTHGGCVLSSAKVHRSLNVNPDGTYSLDALEGIEVEELESL